MPLLLLDLDDTLADRTGAVRAWAAARGRPEIVALDGDGRRPREELFAALGERYDPDAYARELSAAFPPPDPAVLERLSGLRRRGWQIAIVSNGPAEMQRAT